MTDGDDLLALALARPAEAITAAERVLAADPDPRSASVALQTRAIVLRDRGQFGAALSDLRAALRRARSSGDGERIIDVRATLGAALIMAGRTAAGLAELDMAVAASTGHLAGRVLMRRGFLLRTLGRRAEALSDLNRAVTLLRRAGDRVWEARARSARFAVYAIAGQAARAHRDLTIAERLHAETGQELESAYTLQNRADIAAQDGDLPAALSYLDDAGARFHTLQTVPSEFIFDRCKVLLAAGLANEAMAEADQGAARQAGRSVDHARMLLVAAGAALAAGRAAEAEIRARHARNYFRAQGRLWWTARADFILVQARVAAGRRDAKVRASASRIADRLDELGAEEVPAAHLLAGRLAADAGLLEEADRHLARAARFRNRGPSYGHAAGWLAQALRAEAAGSARAVLDACRRGLLAAADHQQRLGAAELRVHAAAHGAELAAMAQRHALRRGDARMLLRWSERWRAGTFAAAPARAPDDRELAADLDALRDVMGRLDDARSAGITDEVLERDRARLEAAIRSRTRHTAGRRAADPSRLAPAEVVERLDGHLLVELVAVDGMLHVVTARRGRVRMHLVGSMDAAVREIEMARFMLRRLVRGRPPPDSLRRLGLAGAELEKALLGPAAAELGEEPVVIAPPGALHAVPWAMLPALRHRTWTVSPSAGAWAHSRQRPVPRRRHTVIVVGPGLTGTEAEAARIAEGYPNPLVLTGGQATSGRVLAALDGASTGHLAAHGVFRADSPLFSSLRLDDGPLTIYDLGRLRRAPDRLILSSCESAVGAAVAGDELLGMISVLAPLGTTSLIASVVPVNDAAAAPFMSDLHVALRSGAPFGRALAVAREGTGDDPVAVATSYAFLALGR